ncbi:hypothetical protein Rsub_05872 [Raphidocelis subcapitata]|uniref:Uncharacterized protein n=1 Tax=Raphidocelis subcapitata TaxID=307507 RepID=A0A2V0P5J7_9CHLO|nr:hypothetical protein Rsub_05872 [Raphidocelis subcapitata]|eukprot:GBF93143.1 hypothetical protein Rsub_05872 [Raphidocelis subcapitata]
MATRTARSVALVLVLQFVAAAASAARAEAPWQAGTLSGPILVLSLGSMRPVSGPAARPAGWDTGACAGACRDTDGCAGWSFCWRDGGCGAKGECDAYIKQLQPPGPPPGPERVPVPWFGRHNGPVAACTAEGRWPAKACTLRGAPEGGAALPAVTEGPAAEGWVSGRMPQASAGPGCPIGVSGRTCRACAESQSPADCLACVARARLFRPPRSSSSDAGAGAAPGAPTAVEACTGCAALPDAAHREACAACVADFGVGSHCASCLRPSAAPSGGYNATSSAECFGCVVAGGAELRDTTACSECFVSRSGGAVDTPGCVACVANTTRSARARAGCGGCHETSVLGDGRAGCLGCLEAAGIDSDEKAAACGACSVPALTQVAKQCYGCLAAIQPGGAAMCARLGQKPGRPLPPDAAGLAPKYYSCLSATNDSPSGPSDCFTCLTIPRYVYSERCLLCRTGLKQESAQWCPQCWHPGMQPERAQECQRCLARTTYAEGFAKCVFGGGGEGGDGVKGSPGRRRRRRGV